MQKLAIEKIAFFFNSGSRKRLREKEVKKATKKDRQTERQKDKYAVFHAQKKKKRNSE